MSWTGTRLKWSSHVMRLSPGCSASRSGLPSGYVSESVLRFVADVGMVGVCVPGIRFLSDWYPAADRGVMGIYVGSYSLASGLSFLFATVVADAISWRAAIVTTSGGALIVAPLVLGLTSDHPSQSGVNRSGFDLAILRNRSYLWSVSVYLWHTWKLFGMRNWMFAFLLTVPAVTAVDSGAVADVLVGITMTVAASET